MENQQQRRRAFIRRFAGFTLVELMTALAVGSFLIIGATSVYIQGRRSFQDNESISRLHEDARFALATLEPDIRMASFFGQQARPELIQNIAGPGEMTPAGLTVAAPDCGDNWAINLAQPVSGTNNAYNWTCAPTVGAARPGSDTLVIRRAAEDPWTAPLVANTIYLHSTRGLANSLFRGGLGVPFTTATGNETTHELVTHGYYISTQSSLGAIPSLRRRRLVDGPALLDEEILPGVEDMQIELGVDTDPMDTPNRGSINQYVAADDPMLDPADPLFNPDAQVLAVRLWLLVRSLTPEPGFADNAYVYSDRNWGGPVAPIDVRRLLVSRTIYLRNVRVSNND